jgi:invasion protein IalB
MRLRSPAFGALAILMAQASLAASAWAADPAPAGAPGREVTRAAGPLWSRSCAKPDKAGPETCYIEQFAIAQPQNLVLLHLQLGYFGPDGAPRLLIATPLGVALPQGVRLTLDQDKPMVLPYASCNQGGCVVVAEMDANALNRFTTGKTLMVHYVMGDQAPVDIPVPLSGLAAALKTLDAPKKKP